MKRWLSNGAKAGLTGFAFWHLSRTVDLGAASHALAHLSPLAIAIAALCQVLQVLISALRWHWLLIALDAPLPFSRALKLFLVGSFYGQVLPGSVGGDAVRVWEAHKAGVPLSPAVNSVVLERGATLFALLLMICATAPWLLASAGHLPGVRLLPWGAPVAAAGLLVLCCADLLPPAISGLRLLRPLRSLSRDCRRAFLLPRNAGPLVLTCLAGHINLCVMFWALATGLGGAAPVSAYFALVPVGILAATVPLSIAGWGVRESAMAALFATVGMAPGISAMASLLLGLFGIIGTLPAVAVLYGRKERPGRLPQPAKPTPAG